MEINKLSLPLVVLISSIILGSVFYINQSKKQDSVERFQEKEYLADRRSECYDIYQKELDNWSNVKGSEYYSEIDVCEIRYVKKEYDAAKCSIQQEDYNKKDIKGYYCEINFTKEY